MSSILLGAHEIGGRSRHVLTARHWSAVATAFTLPWSTSGQAITGGIFVLLALLTIEREAWIKTMVRPSALLPVLLFMLLLAGMAWSPDPLGAGGITHYANLLLIPLVMASAITPRQAVQIGYGFLGRMPDRSGVVVGLNLVAGRAMGLVQIARGSLQGQRRAKRMFRAVRLRARDQRGSRMVNRRRKTRGRERRCWRCCFSPTFS